MRCSARPDPAGAASVRIRNDWDLQIETDSARDGYLVLSEINYPGWKATVDGRPVDVERADYLITALPLPAGRHTVAYFYDPLSVKVGLACTLLALGVALVMLGWQVRNQLPRRRSTRGGGLR